MIPNCRSIQLFAILILNINGFVFAQPTALPRAHAHNDYKHTRPLFDAWEQGFISVEADVFLIKGELYVAHNKPFFKKKKNTLKNLYLKPLQEILAQQDGMIYPGYDGVFFLMIDIKTDPEATYAVLIKQLKEFAPILTTYHGDKTKPGPITVFLSGNRPFETVLQEGNRLVALDGRPSDLGKGYSPSFVPVISDNYKNHLHWNGKGDFPESESRKLQVLVDKTHAEDKQLRLWASPDFPTVWAVLKAAGVDLINTDKLSELRAFLETNP